MRPWAQTYHECSLRSCWSTQGSEQSVSSYRSADPAVDRFGLSPGAQVTLLGAWLAVGLLMHTIPALPGPFDWGPTVSLAGATLISLPAVLRAERALLGPVLWTLLLTGAWESVGLRTGLPFGRYSYLPAAGPTFPWGLPLAIPAAWLVLLLPAVAAVERLWPTGHAILKATAAALLMVVIDLVLDPIAVHRLTMWRWLDGGLYYGIPFSNYLGWAILSCLAALPFFGQRRSVPAPWPVWAVAALLLLFHALLGLGHHLLIPTILGLLLGALFGWLSWRESRLEGR